MIFKKNIILYWEDHVEDQCSICVSLVFTFKSGWILFNWKLSGRNNNISETFSRSSTIRIPTWDSDKKCKHFKIKFYMTTIDKDKFLNFLFLFSQHFLPNNISNSSFLPHTFSEFLASGEFPWSWLYKSQRHHYYVVFRAEIDAKGKKLCLIYH